MKEFKTYNQQLTILRDRGMTISTDGKAKRFLEKENYYNVINGYKDLFLEKDANGKPKEPDRYLEGTNFKELQSLYLFDRELRIHFLKYLLMFENSIKSQLAYEFSKRYPQKNSYLDISNFADDAEKALKVISYLTNIISSKLKKEASIQHYIDKHGSVPLWVLVNYMTVGNVSHFYEALTDEVKTNISKFYSEKFTVQYKTPFRVNSSDLQAVIKMTNILRNKCAHEERTFNTDFKSIRSVNIANQLNYTLQQNDNKKIIITFVLLKAVLDKSDFDNFYQETKNLFKKYRNDFKTVSFEDVLKKMGINKTSFELLK